MKTKSPVDPTAQSAKPDAGTAARAADVADAIAAARALLDAQRKRASEAEQKSN